MSEHKSVPAWLIQAINTTLSPYGVSYTPGQGGRASRGYTNYQGAAEYTGLSVSSLRRAVEKGQLVPCTPSKVASGSVRFSYEQLDEFMMGGEK